MSSILHRFAAIRQADIAAILAAHTPDTGPSERALKHAAVAMILRDSPSGLETLFMKRAEHPADPWSGQMSFPGGRKAPVDMSLEDAARRETEEEVGIVLTPQMRIGRLHDIDGGRLAAHRLAVSPFVFWHPDPPEPVHNDEVAATVWVPLDFLADPANVRPYIFNLDPMKREFPAFHYGPYTIWGLTYRIVANFAQLFGHDLPNGEPVVTNVE